MARRLFCTHAAEGYRKQELGTDRQLWLSGEELMETLCWESGGWPRCPPVVPPSLSRYMFLWHPQRPQNRTLGRWASNAAQQRPWFCKGGCGELFGKASGVILSRWASTHLRGQDRGFYHVGWEHGSKTQTRVAGALGLAHCCQNPELPLSSAGLS